MKTNVEIAMQEQEKTRWLTENPGLNEDKEDSKFIGGVLGADGPSKRFDAHGKEKINKEPVFSKRAEAQERKMLNQWHLIISKFGSTGQGSMFKTAEVRRAELEVILNE